MGQRENRVFKHVALRIGMLRHASPRVDSGHSQRVENVAIIDTGLARNPQPGMSQKGGYRPYGRRQWNARNRREAYVAHYGANVGGRGSARPRRIAPVVDAETESVYDAADVYFRFCATAALIPGVLVFASRVAAQAASSDPARFVSSIYADGREATVWV